ncbi:MAG: structural protein [Candidatus Limnocylindrales bacterium]
MIDRPYATSGCPYCGAPLEPLPKAKKRCPSCGGPIYVRSGPDGVRYLLQETDLTTMEALWAEFDDQRDSETALAHNREAARISAKSLRSYGDLGVATIEMLGSKDSCPACAALDGRRFTLADAPAVPVPGCTNEVCRCDYSPVAD